LIRNVAIVSSAIIDAKSHGVFSAVIGTITPPFDVEDTEISFAGDTLLVRLIAKSCTKLSDAAWYGPLGKISDVDATAFGKASIMGIVKQGLPGKCRENHSQLCVLSGC
jgi:hypothetical protein